MFGGCETDLSAASARLAEKHDRTDRQTYRNIEFIGFFSVQSRRLSDTKEVGGRETQR